MNRWHSAIAAVCTGHPIMMLRGGSLKMFSTFGLQAADCQGDSTAVDPNPLHD